MCWSLRCRQPGMRSAVHTGGLVGRQRRHKTSYELLCNICSHLALLGDMRRMGCPRTSAAALVA